MKTITIEGQLRTELGKKATRQLRSQGTVPGVIYGGAKEINFSAAAIAFKPLVYTPDFQFAEIKLNGDTYKCIMKPVGVKDGGKLHIKMKALKVKTYPKYLREHIEVNIDNLELNGNVRVEDVRVEHYEIMNSPRIPVASVTLTRELKQEEAAVPAGAATPAAAGTAGTTPAAATTAPAPAKK